MRVRTGRSSAFPLCKVRVGDVNENLVTGHAALRLILLGDQIHKSRLDLSEKFVLPLKLQYPYHSRRESPSISFGRKKRFRFLMKVRGVYSRGHL
jgi:hypothetical protein